MKKLNELSKHIPNALTVLRFILIPFIIIFIVNDRYVEAFIVLTLSGITDIMDGYIARKFNYITNLGKVLDPLADKSTQVAIIATLATKGIIPMWILYVVGLKEFAMIAVASFLYGQDFVVSSKWYGKLATVLFYLAIVSSFAIKYFDLPNFATYIYYLAIATTLFALVMYYITFYRQGFLKKENLRIDETSKK